MTKFDLDKHTIYETIHGSHAYGTNIETSDTDYRGVAVPPREYFLGFVNNFDQAEQMLSKEGGRDRVIFGVTKFFSLAAQCNPNVIEILFTDESDHITVKPAAEIMLDNKKLFLSRVARNTFAGYARAQLKRIKTHRSWLLNPPKTKPTRIEFGLPEDGNKIVSGSTMGAFNELASLDYQFGGVVMTTIQNEKKYAAALMHWKQYCEWQEKRNKDRAGLESKFGYDTKHAMHLVRLMRMCVEILSGKGVLVKRPDAIELKEIRAGGWDYDRLISESEKLDIEAEDLLKTSTLPESPDMEKLDALCVQVVDKFLSTN